MNEKDKLFVILRLEKATNLNVIYNMPVILLATLGHHTLETEIVQPIGDCPTTFNCNLIWETDRKTMKRMKSENLPIKLECIALNGNGDRLQTIGYVIISIRAIPQLLLSDRTKTKSHWYKFIGVSSLHSISNYCAAKQKPEILLSATITDNLNFNNEQLTMDSTMEINPDKSPIVEDQQQKQFQNIENVNYDKFGGGDMENLQSKQSYRNDLLINVKELPTTPTPVAVVPKIINSNDESKLNLSSKTFTKQDLSGRDFCNSINDDESGDNCDDDQQLNNEKVPIKGITKTKTKVPKIFNYVLVLKSICFNRNLMPISSDGIWQLSFQHSKAITPTTRVTIQLSDFDQTTSTTTTIDFDNLELRLSFSSSDLVETINERIESEPSTLIINGPNSLYAMAELDNHHLLAEENQIGIILMENEKNEKIAMCYGSVYLENLGTIYNIQKSNRSTNETRHPTNPPSTNPPSTKSIDNEKLTYKFIDELEQWKLKEQELFLEEIKKRGERHLMALTTKWNQERLVKEKQLNDKLEQCERLTTALEEAQRTLKETNLDRLEYERIFGRANLELERVYSQKLLQLREMARRLEADHSHRIQMEQIKYEQLQMENNLLIRENHKLKDDFERVNELRRRMNCKWEKEDWMNGFDDVEERSLQKSVVLRTKNSNKKEILTRDGDDQLKDEQHQQQQQQQYLMQSNQNQTPGIFELLAIAKNDLNRDKNDLKMIRKELEIGLSSTYSST